MAAIRRMSAGLGLFVLFCVIAFLVGRWLPSAISSAQARTVLAGKPYTMMQITVSKGKDGTAKITEQRMVAVDRGGAELWIGTFPQHPDSGPVRRIIRSDGKATIAFEKLALRISEYVPTRVLNASTSYAEAAGQECRFRFETDLGRTTLAGIAVSVSQYQLSKARRETVWRALDYACVPVSVRIEDLVDGRWELFAESTLAWFHPGDPSPELFNEEWFDRLREASPAEALRRIAAAGGVDAVQCPSCYNPAALQELEERYYRNQAPQP